MRLATHALFRTFVTNAGLEFYPLGGDPVSLARCAALTGGESCSCHLQHEVTDESAGNTSPSFALGMHLVNLAKIPGLFAQAFFPRGTSRRSLSSGGRWVSLSASHTSRTAIMEALWSQCNRSSINFSTCYTVQIDLYLEHQLHACSQPDPDAPGAPPFRVGL